MKAFRIIGVLFLLVLFPALSWYYLQSGYDYRLELVNDLRTKVSMSEWKVSTDAQTLDMPDVYLNDNLTVVYFREDNSNDDAILKLFHQFEDAYKFQLLVFNSGPNGHLVLSEPKTNLFQFSILDFNQQKKMIGNDMAIIDVEGNLRYAYNKDISSFQKLVEHTTVLLPKKPQKDIAVKSNNVQ